MSLFKQITVVGVGLIGGSLAKSIRKKRICKKIVGFFRNKEKLKRALKEKIVDDGYLDLKKSIQNSDLIILALPISQIISFMSKIKKISKNTSLIIDIGSTKLAIAKKADKLKLNFVGTHPLAGSEKKGLAFSSDELFNNSKVLITPTKNTDKRAVSKIKLFWKRLNAQTVIFSPKHHDKILSYTSHLPHLTAFCLINSIPKDFLAFGASGLKDTTRIALSDVQIWSDIILSNRKELLNSLSSFEKQIKDLKRIIQKGNNKQLIQILKKSKNKRRIIV